MQRSISLGKSLNIFKWFLKRFLRCNSLKDNNRALDSGDLRKVGETACALANSGGGKFTVRGKKRVSEDVSKAVEKVFPNPAYEVRPEGKIFQVEIFAIKNEAGTFQGRVFVRAGNSNVALEGKALQDFLVTRRTLSFDDSFSRAGIDDLELQKLVRFLKKKNPGMNFEEDNVADYLWELGIEKRDDSFAIKNAAVLFFAKEPRRFIPHSEVRLTRFNGTRAEEVRDAICLDSTLPENLDAAQQFVYKNAKAAFPDDERSRHHPFNHGIQVIPRNRHIIARRLRRRALRQQT